MAILNTAALQGFAPPEPFGTARLMVDTPRTDDRRELSSVGDTCTPTWTNEPTWTRVLLSPSMRIRVELIDEDLSNHDPIGTFELSASDIEAAWKAGNVFQVRVAVRTSHSRVAHLRLRPTHGNQYGS